MLREILPAMTEIAVSFVHAAAAGDAELVDRLTGLVNDVYAAAENRLWRGGATRTTHAEVARVIGAEQMAVATVAGEPAGVIRVRAVSEATGEFGMLAVAPEHRGIGVGRALVEFAERHSAERGLRRMRLELLVPRSWRHPGKLFLDDWYRRIGYRVMRTTSVEEAQPELAPQLATPCEFVVYEKLLGGT